MIIAFVLFFLFQSDSVITVTVESSAALFAKAVSAVMLADGNIAVVDQGINSILTISPRNEVVSTVGGKGLSGDAFDLPTDICSSFLLDLFVVDHNNRRVLRFDKHMNVVQTYSEENIDKRAGRFQPIASAVTAQGDIFILEQDQKRVAVFNSRGQFVRDLGTFNGSVHALAEPKDIVISPDENVFVLDKNRIVIYDIFGNVLTVRELGPGVEPTSIAFGNRSLIITAPDCIRIVPLDSNPSFSIRRSSLIGAEVNEPFVDAVISGSSCIILTQFVIYRCILP